MQRHTRGRPASAQESGGAGLGDAAFSVCFFTLSASIISLLFAIGWPPVAEKPSSRNIASLSSIIPSDFGVGFVGKVLGVELEAPGPSRCPAFPGNDGRVGNSGTFGILPSSTTPSEDAGEAVVALPAG